MNFEPDTWTRDAEIDPDAPVAYVLTREGEVVGAGFVEPEPRVMTAPETDPFADHESHAIDADLGLGSAYYDAEPDMHPETFREMWADMEAASEAEAGS